MNRKEIESWIAKRFKERRGNVIEEEFAICPEVVGVPMFETPLVCFGSAEDALFEEYKKPGVIGPWHMSPKEWIAEGETVISLFFPFTEVVRKSNRNNPKETSPAWLHGRIEGQEFLAGMIRDLNEWLNAQGVPSCAPSLDPRFQSVMEGEGITGYPEIDEHTFGSRWSERHAAYVCGMGTFGLSRGIITKKGMAGRLGSVITSAKIEPDQRPYKDLYEYCIFCGACVRRCPVQAISMEGGKEHLPCRKWLLETKKTYAPRFGCGQCQTMVPCESRIPAAIKKG